jgi:hypothetical protein
MGLTEPNVRFFQIRLLGNNSSLRGQNGSQVIHLRLKQRIILLKLKKLGVIEAPPLAPPFNGVIGGHALQNVTRSRCLYKQKSNLVSIKRPTYYTKVFKKWNNLIILFMPYTTLSSQP